MVRLRGTLNQGTCSVYQFWLALVHYPLSYNVNKVFFKEA